MTLLIADAGPLIALARIERLELLKEMYGSVIMPPKVYAEFEIGSDRPGAQRLNSAILEGWLQVVQIDQTLLPVISASVDEGEAEAITLAIARNPEHPQLLIDDRRGRLVAKHHNLRVIGTAGIILAARKCGLLQQVKPILGQLRDAGYRISVPLCNKILELAGEPID